MRRLVLLGLVMLAFAPATASAKARWFGFNDNSTIAHRLTPKQDAKLLARAGANAARITVDWSWVQYQRGGRFNFDFYDPIFRAWRARGIRPVLVVTGAPKWAWTPWVWCVASDCHFPPDRSHDADWQRFVAAVAQRFPSAVAIEVWNEPNLTHFWASGPDPARYTELLRGARAAVKGVAPRMPVLGGSLAPVRGEETTAIGEGLLPFLRGMYANGARGLMDGISLHPYPFGRFHGGVYETIDATLAARDAAGDRTPLWLTETGLSTTDGYNAVQQAMVLGDLVPRLRRRPEVRGVFVHTLVDPARPNPADPEDGFGIMRGPRAVKPAFCALARRHCKSPGLPLPTRRAWSAQERLQSAVEGALAYHRQMGTYSGLTTSVLHALVPRLSAIAPDESALPGPASRPSRIAVLDVTGGTTVRLCNASKFARSYCVTISPGEVFRFTTALGSIGAAASAADAPDAETW